MLKKIIKYIDDILYVAGGALISIGVFFIYIPAGYIVAGGILISLSFIVAKGRASK